MKRFIIFIFIFIMIMLQMAIFSQLKIQAGKADLILLVVIALGLQPEIGKLDNYIFSIFAGVLIGFISAEPFWIVVIAYFFALIFSLFLKERLPQVPILSMIFCGIVVMIFHLFFQAIYFNFLGFNIDYRTSFYNLILPSLMINIIATLPIFFIVSEVRRIVFPSLEEL